MARVTRLVIGEKNFNDAACGFSFKASVCEPTEEIDDSHIRVRRLLALFPGSTVETTLSKPAQPEQEPDKKKPETKVEGPKPGDAPKADAPAPEAGAKADSAPEPEPGAKPAADAAPDAKPEPEARAEPVVTVEAPGVPNSADPKELAKAVGEDHAARASDETAELAPVAKLVAGEGQNDPADAGDTAESGQDSSDAKGPDGE